jgi:hypothetical protein
MNLPGDNVQTARKANNLTVICEQCLKNVVDPRRLTTLYAYRVSYTDRFNFFLLLP